jgi:hypothetical protein
MRFIQNIPFANITATADAYSTPIDISSVIGVGMHAHVVSGTAKGKAYYQVSCDPTYETPGNFVTYGNGADLTGSAAEAYEFVNLSANWLRIWWDHASGTGTLRVHVKTIGY